MKTEFVGEKKLTSTDDSVRLGVRLTLFLTSENDSEHDMLTRLSRELKQDGLAEKIYELMTEWT